MLQFREIQKGSVMLLEVWGQDRLHRETYLGSISQSGTYAPSRMTQIELRPQELRLIADHCILRKTIGR